MLFSFPGVYLPHVTRWRGELYTGSDRPGCKTLRICVMISVGVTEDTGLSLDLTLHRAARFHAPEARCVVLCCVALVVWWLVGSPLHA
jgi:hypothetical protein